MSTTESPALHQAAQSGDLKSVEKLVLRQADSLSERDGSKRTALHVAAEAGQQEIVEWMMAARSNRLLRSCLDINASDASGHSPLLHAIRARQYPIALLLLRNEASPFLPNHAGQNALHVLCATASGLDEATRASARDLLETLLEKGITATSRDAEGRSALHLLLGAAPDETQEAEWASSIMKADATSASIMRGESGITPLELAAARGRTLTLSALLHPSTPLALCRRASNNTSTSQACREQLDQFLEQSKNAPQDPLHPLAQARPDSVFTQPLSAAELASATPPSELGVQRRSPGLITRCRTLEQRYPTDHVEVKILTLMLDNSHPTKLNSHMKIKQVLRKLKEDEMLGRSVEDEMGLYVPARSSNAGASPIPSSPARKQESLRKSPCSDTAPVWLDPELCLWHYGISDGDLISLKRLDKEVFHYIWLRVFVRSPMGLVQKTVRVRKGTSIRELSECLHGMFMRLSNQFMGLYLYDEHHTGHWMDQDEETIEYYGLRNMDVIELRERSVYKIGFLDESDTTLHVTCSGATLVAELVKMLICCISSTVDDPTTVGLCCVRQHGTLLPTPLWLDPQAAFGDMELHQEDELFLKAHQGLTESETISRLVILTDPHGMVGGLAPRRFAKMEEDLPLLPHEQLVAYAPHIRYLGVGQPQQDGSLFVTNARVLFARQRTGYLEFGVRISMGSVERVVPGTPDKQFLDLFCKDLRTIRFLFLDKDNYVDTRRQLTDAIQRGAFPDFQNVFAFYYHAPQLPRSALFTFRQEFERLKIPTALWRLTEVNRDYAYCSSYPEQFIVPASVEDSTISEVFPFRSKGRISILTYYHSNSATITRCSQPKVGVTNARSEADELLTRAIREANRTNSNTLYLFDARPKANAIANQALGMGYEKVSESSGRYQQCKLEFLNIDNIHVMRDSFYRVRRLCETTHKDDKGFYSLLDSTNWLAYIKLVLASANKIAHILDHEGASVLLHCSDGWDRTAQLAALAQIFLNPFYRTIRGFQVLVEKDWLAVGHKFGLRCGHADSNYASDQRSPIFLQFIDCVWQCTVQFPCLFEFNERYLLHVMDHVYSCQFGTFLMNNERERVQANLHEITVSVWDDVAQQRDSYLNPFYLPGMGVVYPSTAYEDLHFWKGYFLRHCRASNPYQGVTMDMRALQLTATIESLQAQLDALRVQTAQPSTTSDEPTSSSQKDPSSDSASAVEGMEEVSLASSSSPDDGDDGSSQPE